jgi:hypothetical protein
MTIAKVFVAMALAASATALAGCGNAVTSPKALFAAPDARGQAQPRPGVWGYSSSTKLPTCKVDTSQPVGTWDSCAGGFIVRPGEIYSQDGPDKPLKLDYRFVLARGAPAVLQALELGDKDFGGQYYFAGVRPLKFDAQGRVIELRAWQAMCGPPPPDDPTGNAHKLTDRMIPGLTADDRRDNCIAKSAAPVRLSAKDSDSWAAKSSGGVSEMYLQWVRDGER